MNSGPYVPVEPVAFIAREDDIIPPVIVPVTDQDAGAAAAPKRLAGGVHLLAGLQLGPGVGPLVQEESQRAVTIGHQQIALAIAVPVAQTKPGMAAALA